MAITSAFKQFQRNLSPSRSLSDIGFGVGGTEGLPGRMEAPLSAAPLQRQATGTGGGGMVPGATNIMMPLANLASQAGQQQYVNPFAGATYNFPIVQPRPAVGATYNITTGAAPFNWQEYLNNLLNAGTETTTDDETKTTTDDETKTKTTTTTTIAPTNTFIKQLQKDNERIKKQNRLLDIYRNPISDLNRGFKFEDTKAAARTHPAEVGSGGEVERLVSANVDRATAQGLVNLKNIEDRRRDRDPVADHLRRLEENKAAAKAANEAANKRNPANTYGVGTFRTTPGVGRGFSGGF